MGIFSTNWNHNTWILYWKEFYDGLTRIDWDFLNSLPSRKQGKQGFLRAEWFSLDCDLYISCSCSVGNYAGIYLEEYGDKSKLSSLLN